MKLIRYSGLVAVASVAAIAYAFAAGMFPGYPIVGGASYCGGYGGDGTVCVTTAPAGPTALTGNELIPADTKLSSGAAPQTVLLPPRAINGAPITYYLCTSATCGTQTIGNNSGGILLDYSTTITSATVNLPVAPMDGQRVYIMAPYTISTLAVVAGAGTTLAVTTPTVLTASTTVPQGYAFMYVASTTKWYRVY